MSVIPQEPYPLIEDQRYSYLYNKGKYTLYFKGEKVATYNSNQDFTVGMIVHQKQQGCAVRKCMNCSVNFSSESKFNRLCPKCNSRSRRMF